MGLSIDHRYVDVDRATLSDIIALGWMRLREKGKSDQFICPECAHAEYVPVEGP